ncbi:MAG: universal stress protein [Terriglobales bacterium]
METVELKQSVTFKNILLATDFSEVSRKAVPYAAAIASRYGSKIHLAHVLPAQPRMPIPIEPLPGELVRERLNAELEMEGFLQNSLANVPHDFRLERGPIWDALSDLIQRDEIDLLVLGTHGRGGLKKVILGSVAEELFRLASCPVLTVGPAVPAEPGCTKGFRKILFATDFGPASLNALHYAISLAAESKSRLMVLHVVTPVPVVEVGPYWYPGTDLVEQQHTARIRYIGRLKQLIPPEANLPFEPEFLVEFDFASDAIVKTAADSQADLIVMGVNQTASARASAHLPWATAHEVVCHAKCPVLTVRS